MNGCSLFYFYLFEMFVMLHHIAAHRIGTKLGNCCYLHLGWQKNKQTLILFCYCCTINLYSKLLVFFLPTYCAIWW